MKLKRIVSMLLAGCFVFLGKQLPASAEFIRYLEDANQDYSITAEDALSILNHVVGKNALPEEIRGYCDVDSSGHISADDALLVLKKVVGSIKYFPAANSPEDALCKGTPVIIFCKAAKGYTDVYHYMDLTGFDENYLYFADPLKSRQIGNLYNYVLYYSELEELWDTGYPEYSHLFIVIEKEAPADK